MPQAADDDHERLCRIVGDAAYEYEGSDRVAIQFLERKGWTLTRKWQWKPPFNAYESSEEEHFVIYFLQAEWDFGWIDYGPYYEGKRRVIDHDGVPYAAPQWTWKMSKEARDIIHRPIYWDDPWIERREKQ